MHVLAEPSEPHSGEADVILGYLTGKPRLRERKELS